MKNPLSPYSMSEQLMYSTIRLEIYREDGLASFGTAFRYSCMNNGLTYNLIVTAKHNLEDARAIKMGFRRCDQLPNSKGQLLHEMFEITLEELDGKILEHPHEDIDLAALDYTSIHKASVTNKKTVYVPNADEECIRDDSWLARNLSMVEEVIMPGYPLNIFDDVHNFPLFRRGITASHPSIDFQNKRLGAVDIACHPGSSGSPVYVINEKQQWNGKSKELIAVKKPLLLGVLTKGVRFSSSGAEIIDLPTHGNNTSSQTPINLGYYTKAKEVKLLGEQAPTLFEGHKPVASK